MPGSARSIARLTGFLLLLAAGLTPAGTANAQGVPPRPNVLFIAVDDWNDWMGAMQSHPQVRTPNIDRLAARGTLFLNAHTAAPLCNPSRTAFLTGLRESTTGIYGLAPGLRTVPALSGVVTLPQYFAANGYRTMQAGKIFHGGYGNADFQETAAISRGYLPPEKLVKEPIHMGNVRAVDWGVTPPGTDTVHSDYRVASWAEQKLGSMRGGASQAPFFMALGFVAPHVPYFAEQRWFDLYPPQNRIALPPAPEGDRADVPPFAWYLNWYLPEPRLSWLLENREWESKVRAYLAAISFMDAQVGRVLDALERNGLADNTIVVLFSDHGYHFGEKDLTGKNTLWERSTRVPLVYAGPGVSAGGRSLRPTDLMDLYPTLVEMAGLPAKAGLEGLSMVPQLKNADAPRTRPAITESNPGNTAVRSERYRYIRYADGSQELYDHYRDPDEFMNLAAKPEYSAVIADLARWIPPRQAPPAPGSASRVLWKQGDTWFWEGKPIVPSELID